MFAAILTFFLLLGSPDAVYLLNKITITFQEDGSISEHTQAVIIPLTGRGVQRYSNMSIAFRSGMEDIDIVQAEVGYRRGGRSNSVAEISTGPHRILSRTNRLESSLRETVLQMPGLEIGDTVKVDIIRTIHSLPLSNVYSYSFSPVLEDSVFRSIFQIRNNADVSLIASEPGYFWEFNNLSPKLSHPLVAYDYPLISVATGTPNLLSAEASEALDIFQHSLCVKLDDIVLEAGTDPYLLRSWVADNINYIGADVGIWPGWSPRTPEETLEDGSGVCRDRSVLLTWLLRKAGYEAYPALATTYRQSAVVVDARSFDHMVTVYKNGTDNEWIVLDPTPEGLPSEAGFSFGLRGCSFLPVVPGGSGLEQIPIENWNDTLRMTLTGNLDMEQEVITGTLRVVSNGVALELITTLFTQSLPSARKEMFRRFYGALLCDSVSFQNGEVVFEGQWRVYSSENNILLPGLRELSLHGTRVASMILPCPPDSFVIDAPATEILQVSLSLDESWDIQLALPVNLQGYSCEMLYESGTLFYTETADITDSNSEILETLLVRSGTSQRIVKLL